MALGHLSMSVQDLRVISPNSFKNKLEGYAGREKKEWERAVFIAVMSGNSMFYKKPLKQRDYEKFYRTQTPIQLPTPDDTKWMDRHYGRKLIN